MKIYNITYEGLWLGGTAIVLAENEEQAIELARNDRTTVQFKAIKAELIEADLTMPTVLYNDNGDY